MNNRQRSLAILNYESYDRIPAVHFGFWKETLEKWYKEGHLSEHEAKNWTDGNEADKAISGKLGFDFNWYSCFHSNIFLNPGFERKVVEVLKDGTRKVQNRLGVTELEKDFAGSIPAEVDHLLKDRKSWKEHYVFRLKYSEDRIDFNALNAIKKQPDREIPLGIHCGSLFGNIRNLMGVEGISYLYADDEALYDEIINAVADLCYKITEKVLSCGVRFDFGHFWEDICFKNGPLVNPSVFDEKVGPHYRKITHLLKKHGIQIISLDCDGLIDSLIPTWFGNGINTMFPIEVGTWNANIKPWREKYGKELRGVGGMDKKVFACDYAAIDAEIQRLRPLIELGGYIPCPDHRIPMDAKWENVQYYCEKIRNL